MNDNNGLYFISLIERALDSKDPDSALMEAFKKIGELGLSREYQEGFLQFQAFLKASIEAYLEGSPDREQSIRQTIYLLLYELTTDSFEGVLEERTALIETFMNDDQWRAEYGKIKSGLANIFENPPSIKIEVLKDDKSIASHDLSELPIHLKNIEPGQYTIRLSNGRVLWEGQLLKKDLIWADAYADEDLPMAARTEDLGSKPSVSETLLGGELTMEVIPGLNRGGIHLSYGK